MTRGQRLFATTAAVAAVLAIGWIDYITGPEIGLSLLYLVPIAASGWFGGTRSAIIVATLAAAAWLAADLAFRDSTAISLWNGFTRLVIYVSEGVFIAVLHHDREELRRLVARESLLARTDHATRLPNVRAFLEVAEAELRRASRDGEPVAVIYIDLDNFKTFNDRLGHAAGDDILEEVARVLFDSVRDDGFAARLGGDEFAVLLRGAGADRVRETAGRIIESIRDIARFYSDLGFGATAGVAFFQEELPENADELIRAADDAMYAGKAGGKGQVVMQGA